MTAGGCAMSNEYASKAELAAVTTRLDGHEDLCAERYRRLDDHMAEDRRQRAALWNEMRAGFNGIYARLWMAAGSLIGVLVVALGYFLVKFGLPGGG